MLSRVAENLYWVARYVERAENVARLLDVGFHLELDASGFARPDGYLGPTESVLMILACRDAFDRVRGTNSRGGPVEVYRDGVLRFLTFDRKNGHSIISMLGKARENARASQDTLGAELWFHVNRLYLYLSGPTARRRFATSPSRFYDGVKRACILFNGLAEGSLPRNEVYHFLQLGRYLERVNQVSRILNVKMHGFRENEAQAPPTTQVVHWSSLLRSCSAFESYLRENHERIDPEGVVRYLVLDPNFPRALRFCVARCCESLREIADSETEQSYSTEAERLLGRLDSELRYIDVGEIFSLGLSSFLVGVQEACHRVGTEVQHAYFLT